MNEIDIGEIGNHYGRLTVKEENGSYFWTIEDWDDKHWKEIPETLYRTLVEYETNRVKQ